MPLQQAGETRDVVCDVYGRRQIMPLALRGLGALCKNSRCSTLSYLFCPVFPLCDTQSLGVWGGRVLSGVSVLCTECECCVRVTTVAHGTFYCVKRVRTKRVTCVCPLVW